MPDNTFQTVLYRGGSIRYYECFIGRRTNLVHKLDPEERTLCGTTGATSQEINWKLNLGIFQMILILLILKTISKILLWLSTSLYTLDTRGQKCVCTQVCKPEKVTIVLSGGMDLNFSKPCIEACGK